MKFPPAIRFTLLILYLSALPFTLLDGHGRGFLADGDHWQGYEIIWGGALLLPLLSPSCCPFFLSLVMMLACPWIDVPKLSGRWRVAIILWSLGASLSVPIAYGIAGPTKTFPAFWLWAGPLLAMVVLNVFDDWQEVLSDLPP